MTNAVPDWTPLSHAVRWLVDRTPCRSFDEADLLEDWPSIDEAFAITENGDIRRPDVVNTCKEITLALFRGDLVARGDLKIDHNFLPAVSPKRQPTPFWSDLIRRHRSALGDLFVSPEVLKSNVVVPTEAFGLSFFAWDRNALGCENFEAVISYIRLQIEPARLFELFPQDDEAGSNAAAAPSFESADLKPAERASLLKLVAGMAVGRYHHQPGSPSSEAHSRIQSDLAKAGLSMDIKTVRKWVTEACALLPGDRE